MFGLRSQGWDALTKLARAQGGLFTLQQAGRFGLSKQLLYHHVKQGRVCRVQRMIYRLLHLPSEGERLFLPWLWTAREGVFSHRTALELHRVLPRAGDEVHLTLPATWPRRCYRPPAGLVLHYEDLPASDSAVAQGLPVVSVERALLQCLRTGLPRQELGQALAETGRLGLLLGPPRTANQ